MAKLLGTTIETRQGESFKLYGEITQEYRDGDIVLRDVPYMLPTNAQNPYLILDVKSNDYPMRGTAGNRYWLDLSDRRTYNKIVPGKKLQLFCNDKEIMGWRGIYKQVSANDISQIINTSSPSISDIYEELKNSVDGTVVFTATLPNDATLASGNVYTKIHVNEINGVMAPSWLKLTLAFQQVLYDGIEEVNFTMNVLNRNPYPVAISYKADSMPAGLVNRSLTVFDANGNKLSESTVSTVAKNMIVPANCVIQYSYDVLHLNVAQALENFNINIANPDVSMIQNQLFYDIDDETLWLENYEWTPYNFGFKKTFYPFDTEDFINQKYSYSIRLATGQTTLEYLQGIFESLYPLEIVPDDLVTLKEKVCAIRKDLSDVDTNVPLINYTTQEVILKPSKFIVKPII